MEPAIAEKTNRIPELNFKEKDEKIQQFSTIFHLRQPLTEILSVVEEMGHKLTAKRNSTNMNKKLQLTPKKLMKNHKEKMTLCETQIFLRPLE